MTFDELKDRGVFFQSTSDRFLSLSVNLATALHELGIPVYSNVRFREPLVSDFIFQQPTHPVNPGMLVLELLQEGFKPEIPYQINGGDVNVQIISMCDTIDSLNYSGAYPVHRAHCNRLIYRPYKTFPVAFGISKKLEEFTKQYDFIQVREAVVLRNFRPSENQYLRLSMDMALIPNIEKYLPVDRRVSDRVPRWDHAFYDTLARSLVCLCYGGNYLEDSTEYYERKLEPSDPRYSFLISKKIYQSPAIIRWDSWRLWESLAMGCLTIHLDFEKYGFELPEMPENWVHYVGLSLDNLKEDVERMMDDREQLAVIAENGRNWALEHYTPIACAKRFLKNAGVVDIV